MKRPDIHSLLAIAMFIAQHRSTTPQEIADHLGLNVDSVIDGVWSIHMADAGFGSYFLNLEIDMAEDGDDVWIEPDSHIQLLDRSGPRLRMYLSAGETIVALHLIDQILGVLPPDDAEAASLAATRDKLAEAAQRHHVHVGERFRPSVSPDVLAAVWEALREKRQLTVTYTKPVDAGGLSSLVTLKPASLKLEERPYLACLSGKKDVRWYRLDRMSAASVGDPIDEADLPRLARVSKKANAVAPTEGESVTFVTTPRGQWVAELIPSTMEGTDPLRITVQSTSSAWLRSVAIMLGPDLLDIEPASAKQSLVDQAREILQAQRRLG